MTKENKEFGLIDECNQLISIFVASVKTAKQNKSKNS